MLEIINSLRFQGDMTVLRAAGGIIVFLLLCISSYSDIKTRRIPKYCSYSILLISLALLIADKEYFLAAFFIVAILSTGSMLMKGVFIILAVILLANKGEWVIPLIVGFILGDVFFSTGLIGGGDAQLLYGMIAYAYKGWGLLVIIAGCTIVVGIFSVVKNKSFSFDRLKNIISNMQKGKIKEDRKKLQMPFACVLTVSAFIYGLVNAIPRFVL